MTKFQFKIARVARTVRGEKEAVSWIFLFCSAGIVILAFNLFYSRIVWVPIAGVTAIVFVCELINDWASRKFAAKFEFSPHSGNEKEVLEKLRKLAVWLGRELKNTDNIVPPGLKNSVIRELKNSFWSTWRLAKAMGFPVFKSWKTHAQIKFVEGEF